jgi:zinc protease
MLTLSLLMMGCGPKEPPQPAVTFDRTVMPEPLAPRDFQLPDIVSGELSNGISLAVVENHEVPLVYVKVIFEAGAWLDPADRPGLASVTLDMLNEGASGLSAEELSSAGRKIAASLGTGAGLDGSAVSLKALKANIAPSLDLMADVVLRPDFPEDDWGVIQQQRLQNLDAARQAPRRISRRAFNRLMYGETYAGNLTSAESYSAITTDEMRSWYSSNLHAGNATILVGGDTTLAEIQPLLEERFGAWSAKPDTAPPPPTTAELPEHTETTIYLIDKPGAPQSVIRMGQFVGARTDAAADAFMLANMVVGGQFIARINMNLREDKGWTYGASSWVSYSHLPGMFGVGSSVVTPHTAAAIAEILKELDGPSGDAPLTSEEFEAGRGNLLGEWPLKFENPDYLLDRTIDVARYGLSEDWLKTYPDRIRAVQMEQSAEAWSSWLDTSKLVILVVGDSEQLRDGLEELSLPIVTLDADGNPIQ